MFLRKYLVARSNLLKKYMLADCTLDVRFRNCARSVSSNYSRYNISTYLQNKEHKFCNLKYNVSSSLQRKCYSSSLLDGDSTLLGNTHHEKEIKKLTELFPQPRVTLNELQSRTPQKIFEVHYKQNVVAPKGKRRKVVQSNEWVCTYAFNWPEKMKFESIAISKRQAAEKAAVQALHWLYINKRITDTGVPIYDQNVLKELKSSIKDHIRITVSDKSMDRINRIWDDYENGIKDIYEATFKESKRRMDHTPPAFTKDSTIDEDDFSDNEADLSEDTADLTEAIVNIHPVYGKTIKPPTKASLERRDRVLTLRFQQYDEELTPLPIDQYSDQITSAISQSRVVVVVGAAGCGKSTRAPAAVLRRCGARGALVVTQPRRVAAIGLAERVAAEMNEQVGETIGYQVRLHANPPRPPGGSILYCTSGVLLRRLQTNPGLEGCSHVFIDEAHERDVNTDITLLLLKRALDINPDLKIVVMSATLDIGVFTKYFESCPVIEVPGRTFPVQVLYVDEIQKKFNITLRNTVENCTRQDGRPHINCLEVAEVIKSVDKTQKEGAILVFLPGWAEIKLTKQLLDNHYGASSFHMILPVHSRLSTTDQSKMFAEPPLGVRKIVVATNVAETSITIPDVVHVLDAGGHKENRIQDNTGTASLETVWVSRAGAIQRMGRAGRVQPGYCYKLYTKEKENEFSPHTTPEILRIPLEQTVLDCKTYAPDDKVEDFLSQLPEPPTRRAIQFAVNELVDLGALTPAEQLTRLGTLLSRMSVHPRLGRGVLHAAVVGSVLSAVNVVTHCSDNIEIFRNAADRREEIRGIKRKYSETSDHVALYSIQEEFEEMSGRGRVELDNWCERLGLRKERLRYVSSLSNLHLQQLLKSGMIEATVDPHDLTRHSHAPAVSPAVLWSGLGVGGGLTTRRVVRSKGKLKTSTELFTGKGDRAHIGSESVNYAITKTSNKTNLMVYFGGYHSVERRALVVYKTSLLSPHAILLFSMGDIVNKVDADSDGQTSVLSMPKFKLKVYLPNSQAECMVKAKHMLWNTFQYYIDRDLQTLDFDENTSVSRFKARLVKAICKILVEGDREYVGGKTSLDFDEDLIE